MRGKPYEIDFDKVNTIDSIKRILQSMGIVVHIPDGQTNPIMDLLREKEGTSGAPLRKLKLIK